MSERSFNRYIAPTLATSLAIAIGGTACGGESLKTSPETTSPSYRGDKKAEGKPQKLWPNAVVAEVELQQPVTNTDMVACFTDPGGNWHRSQPLPLDPVESTDIIFRVGPNRVKFGVVIQSRKKSNNVAQSPETTFEGPEPYDEAVAQHPNSLQPKGWKPDTDGICSPD
jgi:hypothetical protein